MSATLIIAALPPGRWAHTADGGIGASSRATAQITVVVPDLRANATIEERCGDRATVGYVPVIAIRAAEMRLPEEGRFMRCASGAMVFLVPAGP